jgi:hypothetical protein
VRAPERLATLLHPGTLPARRGLVGFVLIMALFVGAAALGLAVASQHHGVGPTAQTFAVKVSTDQMSPNHLRVRDGDQVVLSITGDRSETIVLQGYQQRMTLIPSVAVVASFVAGKAGSFNFVVEGSSQKLGVLEVTG